MKHHVPNTNSLAEHFRLLAWREFIFGGTDGAEDALHKYAVNEIIAEAGEKKKPQPP